MFKNNRYTKIYYQIIERAKSSNQEGYAESHHVVPKSFFKIVDPIQGWIDGDPNVEGNLVYLSAKEHILCHILLTEMVDGFIAKSKVNSALVTFLGSEKRTGRKLTLRESAKAREAAAVARKGVRPISDGIQTKMISPETDIPEGWVLGKGFSLYNNGTVQINLYPTEEIPEGFVRGGLRGWNWYRNDTGENLQVWEGTSIPEGFYLGKVDSVLRVRSRVITDGTTNRYISEGTSLPEGFRYGVVGGQVGARDWYWVTNGIENLHQKITDELPVGYQPGRTDLGGWYNNGLGNKYFKPDAVIPADYNPGIMVGNATGTTWFNNGVKHKRIRPGDEVPNGFVEGKMKANKAGKEWYTDGKVNVRLPKDKTPPFGFKLGKTPRNNKGLRFYTNGKEVRRFRDGEVPPGFRLK